MERPRTAGRVVRHSVGDDCGAPAAPRRTRPAGTHERARGRGFGWVREARSRSPGRQTADMPHPPRGACTGRPGRRAERSRDRRRGPRARPNQCAVDAPHREQRRRMRRSTPLHPARNAGGQRGGQRGLARPWPSIRARSSEPQDARQVAQTRRRPTRSSAKRRPPGRHRRAAGPRRRQGRGAGAPRDGSKQARRRRDAALPAGAAALRAATSRSHCGSSTCARNNRRRAAGASGEQRRRT